jgi:hypothetical protein
MKQSYELTGGQLPRVLYTWVLRVGLLNFFPQFSLPRAG